MTQRHAHQLPIGQLVKLNSGAMYPTRWAEVRRQERTAYGTATWVVVVDGPEDEGDLVGAETTISGSETFHGIGWHCVSRLPHLPTFAQ